MTRDELNAKLKEDLAALTGDKAISLEMNYDMLVLTIPSDLHHKVAEWAYNDEFWQFNHFIDITAVDYLRQHEDYRFEVVVHLRSHKHNLKFRFKSRLAGDEPSIATLTDVYAGASWTEREIYDFYGINFTGHPRMTRLLSPDDFVGHPLRKDFPVKGQHRGTFPRGTVVSNKRREAVASPQTKPKPADQMLPRTPWEIRREPLRGKENGNA